MSRTSSDKQRNTLKIAPRVAIEACGGGKFVSQFTRASEPMLSQYIAPHETERFMPIDIALDIDLAAGEPIIARAFAAALGYELVRSRNSGSGSALGLADLSRIQQETHDVKQEILEVLTDGQLSENRRMALIKEISELQSALSDIQIKISES